MDNAYHDHVDIRSDRLSGGGLLLNRRMSRTFSPSLLCLWIEGA